MHDLVGKSLGRYHILAQLGEGGMATVYKAYDTRLERDVAVKVIRVDQFTPASLREVLARFEREAKSLAKLSHPNIVKVLDYGEHESSPYLVLEYLPGGTLKEKMAGSVSWSQAVRWLAPMAEALAYAHGHGIVHRDVKPSNILLTDNGQTMLSDFGVAKILEGEQMTALTGTGMGVGTPDYMAPEQWTGKTGPASDIYSLGVVLYELVTGRRPYTAETPAAILLKQATEALPRPTTFAADLPDALEKVIVKALARLPEDRYESMAAFSHALEDLVGAQPAPGEDAAAPMPATMVMPPIGPAGPANRLEDDPYAIPPPIRPYDPTAEAPAWPKEPVASAPAASTGGQGRTGRTGCWVAAIVVGLLVVAGLVLFGVGGLAFFGNRMLSGRPTATVQLVSIPPLDATVAVPTVGPTPVPTLFPTVLPSPTPPSAATAAAGGGILFQDDFSDTSTGWDQRNDADIITDYSDGAYNMAVNLTQYDAWANPNDETFPDDVVVEVDATKNGGPDDNDFGVICRYIDADNFYYFLASSDGYALIGKMSAGERSGISGDQFERTSAIVQGSATNHLRADCLGDTLTLYVNGQQVLSATDSDHTYGNVGLMAGTFDTGGVDILFDDFLVREP